MKIQNFFKKFPYVYPYIISGVGSFCLLLCTIAIQFLYEGDEIIKWSYFASLLSVSIVPGLLGSEQLIYKYSKIENNSLYIQNTVPKYIFIGMILCMLIFHIILTKFYAYEFGYYIYVLPIIGALVSISSCINKSLGHALSSIIAQNLWKLIILIIIFIGIFIPFNYVVIFSSIAFLIYFVSMYKQRNRVYFYQSTLNNNDLLITFVVYIFGIISLLLFQNSERFYLAKSDEQLFADYFLLISYIFTPLTVVSSTLGIIWASQIRQEKQSYNSKMIYIYALLFSFLYLPIMFYIINIIGVGAKIDFLTKIIISMLIISKFQYMCSTAVSIFLLPAKKLLNIHIKSMVIYAILILTAIYTNQSFNIFLILLIICWQYRTFIMLNSKEGEE
jgi:hypothetical protein